MDEQYLSLEGLLALSLFLPPLSMRQYNAVLETLRRVEMPYYYKYQGELGPSQNLFAL